MHQAHLILGEKANKHILQNAEPFLYNTHSVRHEIILHIYGKPRTRAHTSQVCTCVFTMWLYILIHMQEKRNIHIEPHHYTLSKEYHPRRDMVC